MDTVFFFPQVPMLVTQMDDSFHLVLSSQAQHEEAKAWFAGSGLTFSEGEDVREYSSYVPVRFKTPYLGFRDRATATLVKLRWIER
jgi:hypothetical protein